MQVGTLATQYLFEKDVLYLVPLYQRPYVWERDVQLEPLWEDIRRLTEKLIEGGEARAHFLGASVQDKPAVPPGHIETRLLIDGQQRLTTLQLLLKAFEDILKNEADTRYHQAVMKLTRNNHPLSDSVHESFKVWPTNADRDDFQKTMEAGGRPELLKAYGRRSDAKTVGRNIPDAYLYFSETISEWLGEQDPSVPSDKKIPALYSALRDNVRMVVIDLDDKDDAQLIFETLNARGTPLLAADLVKNSLLNEVQGQGGNAEQAYERYWQHFDQDASFWRSEVGRGHAKRPRIEIFLQYLLTLLGQEEVTAAHLYTAYNDLTRKSGDDSAIDRLKEFKKFGLIYRQLQEGHDNPRVQLFLDRLQSMDVGTAYPFLLKLFDRLEGNQQLLITILVDVESFLVRRMVCRLNTRGYNRLFLDLTKQVEGDETKLVSRVREALMSGTAEFDRWPGDDEFFQAWLTIPLYENLTRPRLRLILEALESGLRNTFSETHDVPRNLTVEHVMPQSWQANWPLSAGTDEETARTLERNRIVHTLGNLTLLNDRLNPAQSNNSWIKGDHPESGKREGLREHSVLFLNKQLSDHETWNEENIEERGKALFDVGCRVWKHPGSKGPEPS